MIAFLLSLFFMVLTVVPCSDAAGGFGDKVCVSQDLHLEQTKVQHTDLCTPFCVCSCCGISVSFVQIKKLLPEKILLLVKVQITESTYSYSLLFNAGIWQPPKWC